MRRRNGETMKGLVQRDRLPVPVIIVTALIVVFIVASPYLLRALVESDPGSVSRILIFTILLLVLIGIILLLIRLRGIRARPNRRIAAVYFQIARTCALIFLAGVLATILVPRDPFTPFFGGPLPLLLLGVGFWGFIFGTIGYYHVGGDERFHVLLLKFLTRLTP